MKNEESSPIRSSNAPVELLAGGLAEDELMALRANPRFLARALAAHGATVSVFDWDNEILEAIFEGRRELFVDIDSSIMPYSSSVLAGSKSVTKRLLAERGISVPAGSRFLASEHEQIVEYATSLGVAVVIKPSNGVQGQLVHLDIESPEEIRCALQAIENQKGSVEVIVEEQFDGEEYRVFMTRTGECAVAHREPAFVIGDGIHSIMALSTIESHRRMTPRINCLCPIVIDGEAHRHLAKQGLCLETIPEPGRKVTLRRASNLMLGGFCSDATEIVDRSVLDICRSAIASIPGLPYAGIDFMTTDITAKQTPEMYRILELNSLPGIGMHINPGRGATRDVAGMIVRMIFPKTT